MRERSILNYKYLLAAVAMLMALFMVLSYSDHVNAAAKDYVEGTYKGVVKTKNGDGAKMYTAPGSANTRTVDKNNKEITVVDGTEVVISSEEIDPDGDMWYKVTVVLEESEYTGFLYSGRVTRNDDSFVKFTPTPAPTEEPTPTVEENFTPTPTEDMSNSFVNPDAQTDEPTKEMVQESNTFKPWTYIIILCLVIVIGFIIYTIWMKSSEEKLEREMERYSNRPQYEPLEGELEEDYEQAKSNYYDHIGLGDQKGRSLSDVIGGGDEIELDMTGMFDEEEEEIPQEESYEEERNLSDIISSLQTKLGDKADDFDDDWTRQDDESDDDWAVNDNLDQWSDEEPAEIFADEDEWNEEEHEIPEEIADEEYSDEEFVEETWEEPDVSEHTLDVEASKKAIVANQRAYLDGLGIGVTLNHKVYGVGQVVDNSDDQIIQVSFGDDMRFLKKDKLVEKNLIKF